ncbi:MAG: dihydroorotase [Bdellovibrionales bacterium]
MDMVLKGGQIYKEGKLLSEDLYIKDGKISAPFEGAKEVKISGLTVLPGMIDSQVHFREPGLTHKEDLLSGSTQALLGGVTGFFEMPNTAPPTTNEEALNYKLSICENAAWTNHMFYIGATHNNIEQLNTLEKLRGACGVKIFMGSSTGSLLVSEEEYLDKIVSTIKGRFAVHSESERMLLERKKEFFPDPEAKYPVELHPEWRSEEVALESTKQIVRLSKKYSAKLHLLHVSTAEEMEFLKTEKYNEMSVEVTPQHLTLSAPECYEAHGTHAQMNPPIRKKRHQEALWKALNSGLVDVIGSDHAPHTAEEKAKGYPHTPSGIPGVQTMLPLMLNHVHEGRLSLQRLVELFSLKPAELFELDGLGEIKEGRVADLTVVDLNKKQEITSDWLAGKVNWSPFMGTTVTGWPVMTIVGGSISCRDGELLGRPQGKPYK